MPPEESLARAIRLAQIQNLLYRNHNGLTTKELASACGVSVRTIQRDVLDLQSPPTAVPLLCECRRWRLLPSYTPLLSVLRLTLPEATALFLAVRLLTRASDENNPYVTSALAKLTSVLPERMQEHARSTSVGSVRPPVSDMYVGVFDAMTCGWATMQKVRFSYQAARSANVHEYLLSPYFIEPSAASYAAYAIGYEESYFRAVRTFKLERIQSATLTDQSFVIPDDFNITDFLTSAWGIMGGEEKVTIRLRFAPLVTRRVHESLWHASQVIEDLPDEGCVLTVSVSRPREMISWIRGWGAAVEVLAPEDLRRQVAREAQETAGLYGETAK